MAPGTGEVERTAQAVFEPEARLARMHPAGRAALGNRVPSHMKTAKTPGSRRLPLKLMVAAAAVLLVLVLLEAGSYLFGVRPHDPSR